MANRRTKKQIELKLADHPTYVAMRPKQRALTTTLFLRHIKRYGGDIRTPRADGKPSVIVHTDGSFAVERGAANATDEVWVSLRGPAEQALRPDWSEQEVQAFLRQHGHAIGEEMAMAGADMLAALIGGSDGNVN